VPDLSELCAAAVRAAEGEEAVEAFAEETRHTEVEARKGEVEGLTFAESRGVGVRLMSGGRLGYAWAADPSIDEVRRAVEQARENARFGTPDGFNALPVAQTAEPMDELFHRDQAEMPSDRKVQTALDLERLATSSDPRVTKTESCRYGDAVSHLAIASTAGLSAEYARTDSWVLVVALAEEGDETQTGYSFRVGREASELGWPDVASEAVERATRMLGATKPPTARVPVVLDPFAGSAFLEVLAGALSADAVQKGRSLFANLLGEPVASSLVTLVDDGRLVAGPAASPFDDEGVPSERTELIARGTLMGFLHDTYTARRGSTRSTGNAKRAGFRSVPGVGTSNFYAEAGTTDLRDILRKADGGVLIQEVSGVHSGANPISGEFSVGATGLRVRNGELAEPLREMTIASTLPEMLKSVASVGNDLRFFSSVGVPTILIGEMTVAGV